MCSHMHMRPPAHTYRVYRVFWLVTVEHSCLPKWQQQSNQRSMNSGAFVMLFPVQTVVRTRARNVTVNLQLWLELPKHMHGCTGVLTHNFTCKYTRIRPPSFSEMHMYSHTLGRCKSKFKFCQHATCEIRTLSCRRIRSTEWPSSLRGLGYAARTTTGLPQISIPFYANIHCDIKY